MNQVCRALMASAGLAGLLACSNANDAVVEPRPEPTPNATGDSTADAGAQAPAPDSGMMITNPMDAGTTPGPMGRQADLERAYEWLTGKFDSRAQAGQNPAYYAVQLHTCPVNAPELGDHVLYVEQAIMANLSAPYRQRLYAVKLLDDGRVESAVYSLANAGAAVGLCDRPGRADFAPGDYQLRTGCSVFMTWEASANRFVGSTRDKECQSALNGSTYATAQVELYADKIASWDRGFDANDTQVWGASAGAYIFDRNDTTMPPPMPVAGETCADAMMLETQSQATPNSGTIYTHVLNGNFGNTDDYNPISSSGKAPGCSPVYDAFGNDVVYKFTMAPGQTLRTRFSVPMQVSGGIYVLDSCDASPSWPDLDGSGLCGRNEYRSHGYCGATTCDPVEFNFTWPLAVDGVATTTKDFYLVVDEVGANLGTDFTLEWMMQTP